MFTEQVSPQIIYHDSLMLYSPLQNPYEEDKTPKSSQELDFSESHAANICDSANATNFRQSFLVLLRHCLAEVLTGGSGHFRVHCRHDSIHTRVIAKNLWNARQKGERVETVHPFACGVNSEWRRDHCP